ncbi:hypothetical protein [Foetidibacter luteolus]|uniref:hypothetical protein n=1 Tax=Foetidibacter luteolus TaxID=2608880 RepID=UPI00129BD433|nr:hypothetical protein [Foetidibacter luteolus]
MVTTEIKFLFQGIIFTAAAHVLQDNNGQKEIIVRFNTRYLINNFRQFYKFTLFKEKFAAIFGVGELEFELIQSVQKAILQSPDLSNPPKDERPNRESRVQLFQ